MIEEQLVLCETAVALDGYKVDSFDGKITFIRGDALTGDRVGVGVYLTESAETMRMLRSLINVYGWTLTKSSLPEDSARQRRVITEYSPLAILEAYVAMMEEQAE